MLELVKVPDKMMVVLFKFSLFVVWKHHGEGSKEKSFLFQENHGGKTLGGISSIKQNPVFGLKNYIFEKWRVAQATNS